MLELGFTTGGNNDQIDSCCCLYLSHRNLGACNDTRAASSVKRHDYASPPRLRRGYAHGQWSLRDDCGPPPGSQVSGLGCRARLPQVGLMPGGGEFKLLSIFPAITSQRGGDTRPEHGQIEGT
jgi:hypothetical protein